MEQEQAMKSIFPQMRSTHLRPLSMFLLPILFLVLIGGADACSNRENQTPVTPSTSDSINLPTMERPGNDNPTQQAEPSLATTTPTQDRAPITPGGKYLFIEYWNQETGSGTLPYSAIDFPHYYFDPANGSLEVNPSDSITLSPTDLGFI